MALLIHNFQAESGRVFTDFSADGRTYRTKDPDGKEVIVMYHH